MNKKQPIKMRRRFGNWYSKLQFDMFSDDERNFLEELCKIDFDEDELSVCVYPTGKIEYRFNKRLTRKIVFEDLEQ